MKQSASLLIFFALLPVVLVIASKLLMTGHSGCSGKYFGWIATRSAVFICGAVNIWLMGSTYASRFQPISMININLLIGGLQWRIFFEIIGRFRSRFRMRTIPVFFAAVLFFMAPVSLGLVLLINWIRGVPSPPRLLAYYAQPINWISYFRRFPYNVYQLISPTALVFISYVIARGAGIRAGNSIEKYRQAIWTHAKEVA